MKFDANLKKNMLLVQLVTLCSLDNSRKKNKMEDWKLSSQETDQKYRLKEQQFIEIFSRSPEKLEEKIKKARNTYYLDDSQLNRRLKNIKEWLEKYQETKKNIDFMVKKYNSHLSDELLSWKENLITTKGKLISFKELKHNLNEEKFSLEALKEKEIFLKFSDILELKQLNSLLNNNIIYLQDGKYDLSYIISITKKEIFMRSYYKLAFKIIFLKLLQAHYICKNFSIKDFYFLPLEGLRLYHCENLVYLEKPHHILRCDNCHKQVEYYFERFFSSSSEAQESEFICPNCGEHYTYSKLKEIYEKNCKKAYK